MNTMPEKDAGYWACLFEWWQAHRDESGHAVLAGLMALLRAAYTGNGTWTRRLLDAAMCSVFAFFLQPTLQIAGGVFNWNFGAETTYVAAVFLGFLGVDYISTKLHRFISNRTGGGDADDK